MDDENMLSLLSIDDRMVDVKCTLLLLHTLMTGMVEIYEHGCQQALRFIPEDHKDIAETFNALATSLYFMYDKLDELCYPESA